MGYRVAIDLTLFEQADEMKCLRQAVTSAKQPSNLLQSCGY